MTDPDLPEADRADGAPHPRHATHVVGQEAAETFFLDALNAGRLHHAWLLTGPSGIGKATLAWQIARFLLADDSATAGGTFFGDPAPAPASLATAQDTETGRRVLALSHPGIHLLRREWDEKRKAFGAQISVDSVRKLKRSFTMSLADGGRRIVIVDSADDMNPNAANALLKLLEEPPANTVFLLISHMPSKLLPTIRSRCRTLRCARLNEEQVTEVLQEIDPSLEHAEAMRLAALSGGSAGTALRFHMHDGTELFERLLALFATMPGVDRMKSLDLAATASARDSEEKRAILLELTDAFIGQLARAGVAPSSDAVASDRERQILHKLAPTHAAGRRWAEAQGAATGRVRTGLAVNLDPSTLLLDMVLTIDKTAARCAAS